MEIKNPLSEKEQIERATADAFIQHYNRLMGTSYKIVKHSDAPDFRCIDSMNNTFNFEVTLTEDRPGDIAALLGRSGQLSLEKLREQNKKIKEGKAHPLEFASCLSGNVMAMMVNQIKKKMNKDYGKYIALVVRDTSGCDWGWDMVIDSLRESLDLSCSPYDKGIWIISKDKTNIFRVA